MIKSLGPIRYAYGLDDQSALTHINDATRSTLYKCPGCGDRLTPVLGEVNAKHYRHHEACCSPESYLHKCAKVALFTFFKQALEGSASPAILELERTVYCQSPKLESLGDPDFECVYKVPARYNLASLFDQVALEKRDATTGLTPDVMLFRSNSRRRLYVEVCVTHPCEPEKIQAGIPIIEFKVESEADIAMLTSAPYSVQDERIALYNFRVSPGKGHECAEHCPADDVQMSVWSLSENGRLNQRTISLRDLGLKGSFEQAAWPESLSDAEKTANLIRFIRVSDPRGFHGNCLLCSWSKGWNNGYLECSKKGRRVPYTDAQQCTHYEAVK